MQLRPHYGEPPLLRLEAGPDDPAVQMARQRRRLAQVLGGLDDRQWAAPSRCAGWSVQDVVTHLVSTNQFWTFSIRRALAGEPTRFLANFDPVASPAELVSAAAGKSPAETLADLVATSAALEEAVAAVTDWDVVGEAPPGHVPLRAVVLHALWDSWVHERDVALPMGLDQVLQPDEVSASLMYVAALSPLLAVTMGDGHRGALVVAATGPDAAFVVEAGEQVVVHAGAAPAGAVLVQGDAVELTEAFSRRAPLQAEVPDDARWLVDGLATAFDQA